jgi:hypothetical protein
VEGITDRTCCSRQLIQLIYFAKLEGVDRSTSSKRKKKTKENKRKQKKTKAYTIGKKKQQSLLNNGNIKDARKAQVRNRKKTNVGYRPV